MAMEDAKIILARIKKSTGFRRYQAADDMRSKTLSGGPSKNTCPSFSRITRSASRMWLGRKVVNRTVARPFSAASFFSKCSSEAVSREPPDCPANKWARPL